MSDADQTYDAWFHENHDRVAKVVNGAARRTQASWEPSEYLSFEEALQGDLSSNYVVKGFAAPGACTILFGDSGDLKSFVLLDAMAHVAANLARWCGLRVRGGAVLVITAEGPGGAKPRVRAWSKRRAKRSVPLDLLLEPVDLYDSAAQLALAIETSERRLGAPIVAVGIDPLGLMFGAGDEQSNADMARVLRNARLAAGPQRALILVHHVGHGDKGRERGAYALRAGADFRFQVSRDRETNVITLTNLKAKDGAEIGANYLAAEVIELGTDSDGDRVTSLALVGTCAPDSALASKGKRPSEIAGAIVEFLTSRGTGCKKAELVTHLGDRYQRGSIYREIKKLVGANQLSDVAGIVHRTKVPSAN